MHTNVYIYIYVYIYICIEKLFKYNDELNKLFLIYDSRTETFENITPISTSNQFDEFDDVDDELLVMDMYGNEGNNVDLLDMNTQPGPTQQNAGANAGSDQLNDLFGDFNINNDSITNINTSSNTNTIITENESNNINAQSSQSTEPVAQPVSGDSFDIFLKQNNINSNRK